ncbi:flavin-dependent monooxygenase QhpG [Ruegeria arenilitoris]|uniref:flavin-dependent monooxygenase QhpG n=1 Tax=Ruegeria arenilitoris TaxID=1173585 RepID=UPI00147C93BB|nr:tryptophan 7-halogenase [Ruegeria arenilitoris]
MTIETEICVIGGGPAGAVTAMRLAHLGRRVCLVERAGFPRQHVGESLAPSIWPILEMLGLSGRIQQAGFLPANGSVLHWGGTFERRGTGEGQAGLLIDRGRFDSIVLNSAKEAGVRVLQPVRAYRPVRNNQGWNIQLKTDEGPSLIVSNFLVDAAGRQAGLGRSYRSASAPLLCLYAYWRAPTGFGAQARVEAGHSHWYWSALLPDGIVNAMVFVDPVTCTGLSPSDRRDLYLNLLAQSTLLSPCLEHRRIGPVQRSDATSLCEVAPPAPDLLRVGEASLTVDPLSSQGVQLAMGQAVQAATVVNTLLLRPEDTGIALTFYNNRQLERVRAHAGLAADFYARQQRVCDTDFWAKRATACSWVGCHSENFEEAELPRTEHLILSRRTRIEEAGIQTDTFIQPGIVVVHHNLPRPVANIEGIPLAPLLGLLKKPAHAQDILSRWSGVVDAQKAKRILAWLWRNRILVAAR